ncbi:protein kintoun [Ostrinia furnacalis]|uniref:protein kintoun n=1 Tax=Ostrinia furnacalis TaxID=93504 RepID=UPI00103DF382|nr:protein kintoun [Ostrinia furnacalis]
MATGLKPRDEESQLTRSDLEVIQEAMKNKKFRDLLADYCEEVRDPANQAIYQQEMTQLEKERGYDVTFINPKGGYVIKTSVAGDRKAFINICSNENIGKPSCKVQEVNGQKGMNWQLPYSIIPPREDYDHKRQRCIIYDVVFHPDTLRMAEVNKQFRELVNKTAYEGLQKTYNIHFDSNNFRFPKSYYKGMNVPAVIRKEDPNFKPPVEDESEQLSPEVLEKLYPQRNYSETETATNVPTEPQKEKRKTKTQKAEFKHASDNGYTIPKYIIKQQKNVDFQDYTYHKDCKQYTAIPSHLVVEVNLPLLSSTKECALDVEEKSLCLKSENPAKYKLDITLPYAVNDECGSAKFDKTKRKLIVTLPVLKQNLNDDNSNSLKVDSGVESEENSGSQSDEDSKTNRIEELSSTVNETSKISVETPNPVKLESFLKDCLGYTLPSYTHNVLDDVVAFTFHVKNTEPDSVKVEHIDSKVLIKFTSVGSGFVPVHYAAIIKFDDCVNFDNVTGEAWDNNVILQLEIVGDAPQKFQIGLSEDSMTSEHFDMSQITKTFKADVQVSSQDSNIDSPVIEVTNLGSETNIVVSSNQDEELDEGDVESPTSVDKGIVWTDSSSCEYGAKSILRKPMSMNRSFSESSVGDIASSMDYISSDYIPEEGSLKKSVRFNDVIARQFYRYNSSIEGQKKKNQRKKSKKRSQDRRRSESEAEDDITTSKVSKPRLKSVLKQRRDSGLADTSDAETECKSTPVYSEPYDIANVTDKDINNGNAPISSMLNIIDNKHQGEGSEPTIWKSDNDNPSEKNTKEDSKKNREKFTCDNIKHNTDLYNPDKLNKGKYLEVLFKNDLIFDLDM